MATDFQMKMQGNVSIEKYKIVNGDHCVVVIGRDLSTDPANYCIWNKDAVVADGWAGMAYPASQIPLYLKSYWNYNFSSDMPLVNVCVEFNPNYHVLRSTQQFFLPVRKEGVINVRHLAVDLENKVETSASVLRKK